jgi:hypothetical protein
MAGSHLWWRAASGQAQSGLPRHHPQDSGPLGPDGAMPPSAGEITLGRPAGPGGGHLEPPGRWHQVNAQVKAQLNACRSTPLGIK